MSTSKWALFFQLLDTILGDDTATAQKKADDMKAAAKRYGRLKQLVELEYLIALATREKP